MKFPKDQMTPKERMTAYVTGKAYDRMPCTPMVSTAFVNELGYSTIDYYHRADIMANVAIEGYRAAPTDSVSFGAILHGVAQGLGCKFQFKESSVPVIEEPVLRSYKDLERVDVDKVMDGCILKVSVESLKRVIDAIGDEVSIGTSVSGPFTTASFMIGAEKTLKDLRRSPEDVHKVLEVATAATLKYIDAMNALGLRCSIADPFSSSTLISKRMFEQFSQPYLEKCMDRIKSVHGKGGTIHICGKSKPIWDNLIDLGAGAISIDNEEDLSDIRASHGSRICIAGNVSPVDVLQDGTKDSIYEHTRIAIEKGRGNEKGFVLTSGCGIPIGTSIENINHMLDATRQFGRY